MAHQVSTPGVSEWFALVDFPILQEIAHLNELDIARLLAVDNGLHLHLLAESLVVRQAPLT